MRGGGGSGGASEPGPGGTFLPGMDISKEQCKKSKQRAYDNKIEDIEDKAFAANLACDFMDTGSGTICKIAVYKKAKKEKQKAKHDYATAVAKCK